MDEVDKVDKVGLETGHLIIKPTTRAWGYATRPCRLAAGWPYMYVLLEGIGIAPS